MGVFFWCKHQNCPFFCKWPPPNFLLIEPKELKEKEEAMKRAICEIFEEREGCDDIVQRFTHFIHSVDANLCSCIP